MAEAKSQPCDLIGFLLFEMASGMFCFLVLLILLPVILLIYIHIYMIGPACYYFGDYVHMSSFHLPGVQKAWFFHASHYQLILPAHLCH